MTLHWWMHWFWVTFFHSVVALPLLLPGTFSIPSLEGRHDTQPPLNAPPTSLGDKVSSHHGLLAQKLSLEQKVAAEISHDPIAAPTTKDNNEDITEGSVIGKEYHSLAKGSDDDHDYDKESASEPETSFLEEESQREWRLDEPAPRRPLFLQSPELSELYQAVEENEDLQPSDGMPWLPPLVPHAEDASSSQLPPVEPSQLPLSSTEEPWPEKRNLDDSSAGESHPDVSEGGEIGSRGPRDEPQQLNPEPNIISTELPETISTPETSPLWNLYSSIPPFVIRSSPSTFESSSSSPTPTYSDSSSIPSLYSDDSSSPSPSVVVPTAISDVPPPTLSSLLIPSDTLSSDAVRVREGKAISISHIDQQPKQEQKQVEVVNGGELTASTTMRPTKIEVESSPETSSYELNSTVVVEKEDKVAIENITQDNPVLADSSSSSDKNEESDLNPLTEQSKENNEGKVVIGPKLEEEAQSDNMNNFGAPESDSEKSNREEDTRSPMEVPTAVAVREGGVPVGDVKSDIQEKHVGEEASVGKEATITTAADVPPNVQQGRMTAPKSLDAASIVGISLGSVLLVGAVAGGVGFVLYRRSLYANKPQTLNDKCSNPDSSGYIDDTLRVSSAPQRVPRPKPRSRVEVTKNGGHGKRGGGEGGRPPAPPRGGKKNSPFGFCGAFYPEPPTDTPQITNPPIPMQPRENSEEMYSLDNDSFLNSLEAMTIQNYWTDSVKHTKL